jgi:DNA polymerase III sliding clamp (beta) subunit (PCNA family)
MTLNVDFETATIASAIQKAARVAPSKGVAFEKTAGIIIEIDPAGDHPITVKSTDLEVTYLEWVDSLSMLIGEPSSWRLPSMTLAGILAGLPVGGSVMFSSDDTDGLVTISCGKTRAKLPQISGTPFMGWAPFDATELEEVAGFASRVGQVSWACDRSNVPFTGIHIDGEYLTATDRYRLARVPCKVPVTEAITVPLDVISPMLKHLGDAKLKATDKKLWLMPDEHSQVTSVIFDAKYPDVKKVMRFDYPQSCTLGVDDLKTVISRMLVLVRGERYPIMRLTIGKGVIKVFMNVEGVGEMEDEVSVEGADHEPYEVYFTPTNFLDGLSNGAKPQIKYSYDPTNALSFAYFNDGDGYESWIVPRKSMVD